MRVTQCAYYPLASVLGQIDPVAPSKDFPGADLLGTLLQWGMYLSLALSVGSIIIAKGRPRRTGPPPRPDQYPRPQTHHEVVDG